jgi:hypothetical protein
MLIQQVGVVVHNSHRLVPQVHRFYVLYNVLAGTRLLERLGRRRADPAVAPGLKQNEPTKSAQCKAVLSFPQANAGV